MEGSASSLHEANVFLEIDELPRPYRVSNGTCVLAEEQGLISSCARRDSSSLRITARGFRGFIVKEEAINLCCDVVAVQPKLMHDG
jgi:hypothetical protein